MQSLGAEPQDLGLEGSEPPATPRRRLVLPRVLRRPVRLLARLEVPRNFGTKAAALFLFATGAAGIVLGGHSTTMLAAATAWSGLAITDIEITGQTETSEVEVLENLGIGDFPSLVTFDVEQAKAGVESLPWIDQVTIRKLYPDTLQVSVTERKPFAIWQNGATVSLVDETGRVLDTHVGERYAGLPFVVGEGANKRVAEYVALLEGVPSLKPRIRAGVLISDRRWNIVLSGGVELLLPEKDPADALVQVVALDDGSQILSREVSAIDLRLPNRLVFRLTETGDKARKELLKEREKAAKGKGRA